ncbi:hypothetical protein BGW38_002427 [Lunasporangiospora selenospora]|uniref:Uncharacterized protein n=1 Tax=Lunasporangiospora selenospora TaxID=979761 RepID=A0A9P6FS39_9FUNG|nr:hypothetical protein BGW38_002427 [Lunasporangiospora selenospora]
MIKDACNLPWIGNVVDTFASNTVRARQAIDFTYCCDATGNCSSKFPSLGEKCGLGYMRCTVGNSKYVCKFTYQDGIGKDCYAEGTLARTRNIECCPSKLNNFLTAQKCMSGFTYSNRSWVCCVRNPSCEWAMMCMGPSFEEYKCMGGKSTAICYGPPKIPNYEDPEKMNCIQEVSLGSPMPSIDINCLNVQGFPAPGTCALGGSGPPLEPGNNQTQSATTTAARTSLATTATTTTATTTTGQGQPTGGIKKKGSGVDRGTRVQKWVAVCLVVPVLGQMLFL